MTDEEKYTLRERRSRRRSQRFWMVVLNGFFMYMYWYIITGELTGSVAETGVFMSAGALIALNGTYLFGEIWEDVNVTKTGIKV